MFPGTPEYCENRTLSVPNLIAPLGDVDVPD